MARITAGELSQYLREIHHTARGLDKLKIGYRPYICPFQDLLPLAIPGERVYDVGCGSGQFALLLAKYSSPSWIGGAEINPKLVRNATELFANARVTADHVFEVYDGQTFPESLSTADSVFLIDVFHHVPPKAQKAFLESLYRSMRPGAKLVVKDIDAASVLVYLNKLHDLLLSGEIGAEQRADTMLGMLETCGFKVEQQTYRRMLWYPHFTLLLRRP